MALAAVEQTGTQGLIHHRHIYRPLFVSMLLTIAGCVQFPVDPPAIHSPDVVFPAPPPVTRLGEYRVYYGDLHNHTLLSDGTGMPEDAYSYARDMGHMDFFGLSDHEWVMTDSSWAYTRRIADAFNENNRFVTFCGFEWSSMRYGHCTVTATDSFCYSTDDTSSTTTFSGLCTWLSTHDCIAFFNHPGRIATADEFNLFASEPSDGIVGMELWNKTASFFPYYYNDGFYLNDHNRSFYDEALLRGWNIGAAGGGDNHWASWGTITDSRIAVLAQALTREDILDAFRARRFYSTLDRNLVMSFTADDHEMGSTVYGPAHSIRIRAIDMNDEYFTTALLFNGNHDTVRIWNDRTTDFSASMEYATDHDDYLYVLLRQEDGGEAISSPVWIRPAVKE